MNILEFAINMENEGEKFYREQAKINKDNRLSNIFTALADDEMRHARILGEVLVTGYSEISDSDLPEKSGIFKKHFKDDIRQKPEQIDIYREALKKEQESIDLYRSFLDKSDNLNDTELYGYLVEQEQLHFSIIEDIIYHLEKAESWVESAEFGVREDY